MKSLPIPAIDHEELYRLCVGQTDNQADREILIAMTERVVVVGQSYHEAGILDELFALQRMPMSADEDALMRNVYDYRLAAKSGSGRGVYDAVMLSTDYCPYCTFGELWELDHFIPKSINPEFNVLPINLVPSCHGCNSLKRTRVPQNENDQILHPYFDRLPTNVRWLFADIEFEANGPMLAYRVQLNAAHHPVLSSRLEYHFRELELGWRFRREAASILNELELEVTQRNHELNAGQMSEHFADRAEQLASRNPNSLETAAYYAAAASPQYCSGNFRN